MGETSTDLQASEDPFEMLRALPYAKQVYRAYQWAQLRRLKIFLRDLDGASSELTADDRVKFESYINSNPGQEVLADFAKTAVWSQSETAVAGLAILYSDAANVLYSPELKSSAALSLEGIPERTIDAFLAIMANRQFLRQLPGDKAVQLFAVGDTSGDLPETLAAWSRRGSDWTAAIDDLIARGLLRTDPAAIMRLGDETASWSRVFGVDQASEQFEALLSKARRFLRGSI